RGAPAQAPEKTADGAGAGTLTLFRRIEPGPKPAVEIGSALAAAGFTRAPVLRASLEYERPGAEAATLALVQTPPKHQGTGWDYTIDDLRRYYERVDARMSRANGPAAMTAFPVVPSAPGDPGAPVEPPPF